VFYGRIHYDDSIAITSVDRNRVVWFGLFFAEVMAETRLLGLGVGIILKKKKKFLLLEVGH